AHLPRRQLGARDQRPPAGAGRAAVEAAVSLPASTVERFSRGEAIAVGVDRIERELTALWQEASRAAGAGGQAGASSQPDDSGGGPSPVARAALWNIVIPTHGADSLARTKRLVDDLAPSMPARVIMLARGPGGEG